MRTPARKPIKAVSNPRLSAVEAVIRVTRDGLPLALGEEADLFDPRDRGLAFEIAFGTIRHLSLLDKILDSCMARPLSKKRHFLRGVLRTGLYQVRYLRVPDRAAVNESVNLVKRSPEQAHSGFANAVLRKAISVDHQTVLAKVKNPIERLALEYAHPAWLVERWLARADREQVIARLMANNRPPPLTLRTNSLKISTDQLLDQLSLVQAEAASNTPEAILIANRGSVEGLPGFSEGWFAVQDQAAQWVSRFLDPQPGDDILDACAAPGGKTAHLVALAQGQATVVAIEKYASRLQRLQENLNRLQIAGVSLHAGDAADSQWLGEKQFDRILIDAPCTGTGVIRRHPEIKWRRKPSDIDRMVKEQAAILDSVAQRLRPGGRLVYATCSVEPDENERQVERFLSQNKNWRRLPITSQDDGINAACLNPFGDFSVEPGQFDMDGFYAARLTRAP
ncbi:MAG: 16S rRNA (cytosine(967)-C(5))-methyltransferase RsmB [Magnetococcales bacterium]|nr:16S rRNA (cytosine(967)-C(5))-methyltransferase RsmB [Magnetococcales bacterium]